MGVLLRGVARDRYCGRAVRLAFYASRLGRRLGGGSGGRGQRVQDVRHGGGDFIVICRVGGGEPLGRPRHGQRDVVDYLRPGRGNYFIATGRVVRLGNRVAVAHMDLVNDTGEQIATGGAAYMVG